MVTEPRDVDPGDLARLEDRHALGDLHRVPVHEHLDRVLRVRQVDPGAGDGLPGRELRGGIGLSLGGGGLGALPLGRGPDRAGEPVPRRVPEEPRGGGPESPRSQQP